MVFIVYSQIDEEKFNVSLGMPEYSYYFVLQGFLPVLQELGQVVVVSNPEQEVDVIYDDCRKRNENCVFISFSPPHKSVVGLQCPTVCVFAWEYNPVPNEAWDDDPRNDWRFVLSDHGRVISLSQYSADGVKKLMGENFPVEAIPTPVWDNFEDFRNRADDAPSRKHSEILISGNIIDSRNYQMTPENFQLLKSFGNFQLQNWSGETLHLGFSDTDEFSAYLGGFYEPEGWGTWSRTSKPWILLPYLLSGTVNMKISAYGYGHNANKEIFVSMGDESEKALLKGTDYSEMTVSFHLSKPENILKFGDFDLTPIPGAPDPRLMGIGLRYIEISGSPCEKVTEQGNIPTNKVTLEGVVYTSVFNPVDGRKNWRDIVTAFCTAFRDVEDATLVLKMSHHSLASFLGEIYCNFQQLSPFKCRIVALHGYMDSVEYEKLISATHFYVNSSRCEGMCLPLMEYMACRKPAISPCHTAMADYVDSSSTLIVNSSIEPCIWPHSSRMQFRTMWYRIDWESLVNAYRQSYAIAKNQPDVYRKMAESASLRMKKFSSNIVVKEKLKKFFTKELGC